MSVPIATSPGRSGFGPQLALSYDSGRGNGPFGFGWSLSLPSVTRKTDKGLPRYDDAGESDVFLISDAEDLVPVRDPATGWQRASRTSDSWRVDRYRPRIEGLFARIERWTRLANGDTHWRSVTRDNVTSVYGEDDGSRVADPADPRRVFQWLISRSYDDKGNALVYEYAVEDSTGVDLAAAHEQHRIPQTRAANRYLKRIRYGNRVSRLADPDLADPGWLFEVVLDYGDHDQEAPSAVPDRPWACRPDPFSSYRAAFEVRTYRLCRRVLMFHHFPDEPEVGADCLVRSTSFSYQPGAAVGEFLTEVVQSGHRRTDGGYLTRSLPPLELSYSQPQLHDEVGEIDAASLAGAPAGLAGDGYQWVDLDGDGISGILAQQAGAWYYKPNLGAGRFGPAKEVTPAPSVVRSGEVQLLDLAGDGQQDAVTLADPVPGFFERREHGDGWEPFVAFRSLPHVDWDDPNLRFLDLDGDGHADVLVTEDEALTWYPSLGENGFGPARRVSVPPDDDAGPRLVFADPTGTIHLADMSGDGLTDLVRVRNGDVCYWPNLGHGRFAAKVVMDDAPWFDRTEKFDPRYLRLADVDGTGLVDLIYLGSDGARIWFNRSGNGFTSPHLVETAPRIDSQSHVATVDLFGTGTTCLVWSSPAADEARRSLRYIDLLGGVHPHLLARTANNLGAETHVRYAPSTRFFLADAAAGRPWLTRLPFPVQVVERVETLDRISRNRFVTRYAYHHGYFDGHEREFRGFGMVEQWDTEELSALGGEVDFANEDPASHVPPVLTCTWFHTGMFAGRGRAVSRQCEDEYWQEPSLTPEQQRVLLLEDTHWPEVIRLPDGTALPYRPGAEEVRQACRALKGSMLRQEVYAEDGSDAASRPYLVTEQSYAVELLQVLRDGDRHTVCFTYPRESVTYHYERTLYDTPAGGRVADPRVRHEATLDVDGHGNVRRAVQVGYGRRHPDLELDPQLPAWARDAVHTEQTRLRATLTVNDYTQVIDAGEHYRGPMPCRSRSYELVNLAAPTGEPGVTNLFSLAGLRAAADAAGDGAHDLPYEDLDATGATGTGPYRRLLANTRTLYRRDDLTGPLPLGVADALGLPHESHQLALTPGLLEQVYRRTIDGVEENLLSDPAGVLEGEGGYRADADGWWIPSGRVFLSPDTADGPAAELAYARAHFFLPARFHDPFGNVSTVGHDGYDLLTAWSRDPLGNVVSTGDRGPDDAPAGGGQDYRVLQPWLVSDPNRNRSVVAFDALGMVVATAVMGKPGEQQGDSLDGVVPDLTQTQIQAALADPFGDEAALLGAATTRVVYDLAAFQRTAGDPQQLPVGTHALARERHHAALSPGEVSRIQHAVSYLDGFGRNLQSRTQVEPGPVDEDGPVVERRWVCSGWAVVDNKGRPVRRYEPFHTATHAYEPDVAVGVSQVLGHDPVERTVAVLHPNGSFEKETFSCWRQAVWDVNDAVLLDPRTDPDVARVLGAHLAAETGWQPWHARRVGGAMGEQERQAALAAARHAGTPTVTYLDSVGQPVLAVAHNRVDHDGSGDVDEPVCTLAVLDIEGQQRAVVDGLGRRVATFDFDAAGGQIGQSSMDAGLRLLLTDAVGGPLRGWDGRGSTVRTVHDELRRPVEVWLSTGGAAPQLVARTTYGEAEPDAAARNLRTRAVNIYDSGGIRITGSFDFKGNPQAVTRRLARQYRELPDWSAPVALEDAPYKVATSYDALNRPAAITYPDGTVAHPTYHVSNRLARVEAQLPGTGATVFLADMQYNPRGQRVRAELGNGAVTIYDYHPETFHLTRLLTTAPGEDGSRMLQDLLYTYDPVGNVTHVHDEAQQTVFFRNRRVEPSAEYAYDALYRLVAASGREHLGQLDGGTAAPASPVDHDQPRTGLLHPGDGNALGRYHQRYRYDQVGNLLKVSHQGTNPAHPGWTRRHHYQEPSLLEPATRVGNRLSRTTVGDLVETYQYQGASGRHGNLTGMPHLSLMRWDYRDQLAAIASQVVGDGGEPETTCYAYDVDGMRVRKVTDRPRTAADVAVGVPATRRAERIYLDGFEIYREYAGDGETVTLERQTLHIVESARRIALVETRTVGDDGSPARLARYQLANHLGSACLELDELGRVISYEEYYPYGATSYQAVRAGVQAPRRYRFSGKERDEETGFYYHGARYYAPWLGRWTSCDPNGLDDGVNLYAYVRGRPTRLIDPTGTQGVYDEDKMVCRVEYPTCAATNPAGIMSTPSQAPIRTEPRRPPPQPVSRAAGGGTGGAGGAGPGQAQAPATSGSGSGLVTTVGAVQVAGGGLEMYAGGTAFATGMALLLAPEPVSSGIGLVILGGVLLFHGADTTATGVHTIASGEIQHTFTYQGAQAYSESRGFTEETSRGIATGVDILAGVGPSVGIGLSRRALVTAAEEGTASLTLGYLHQGTSKVGHNVVGVTAESGSQQFFHLRRGEGGQALWVPYANASTRLAAEGYALVTIPATSAQASAALRAATVTVPESVAGQSWQWLGPNCATTAGQVLQAGGVSLPAGASSTPLLLYTAAELPLVGRSTLSVAGATSAGTVPIVLTVTPDEPE